MEQVNTHLGYIIILKQFQGNFDDAKIAFERAQDSNQTQVGINATIMLANCLHQKARNTVAYEMIENLDLTGTEEITRNKHLTTKIQLLIALDRHEEAKEELKHFHKLDSLTFDMGFTLATCHVELGQFDSARGILEHHSMKTLTDSDIKRAKQHSLLGYCYSIGLGDDMTWVGFEKVEESLKIWKSISKFIILPEMVLTHLYKGKVRMKGGNQIQETFQHFLTAMDYAIRLDLPLMQADALNAMGLFHLKNHNYDRALKDFNDALGILNQLDGYKKSLIIVSIHYGLAVIELELNGNKQKAREQLEIAKEI